MITLSRIVKSFLGLSLVFTSTVSFAATFNFHIINSSDSIVNPITITNWYAYAGSNNSSVPACAPKKNQFPSDIKIRKKQEATFSFDPEYPTECYNGDSSDSTGKGVWVAMYLVTVDGKSISGKCQFPGPVWIILHMIQMQIQMEVLLKLLK